MDINLKQNFIEKFRTYFGEETDFPITFWYSNNQIQEEEIKPKNWMCIIGQLNRIRKGESLSFSSDSVSCAGGKAYCGFADFMPGLADYLSTGEERYLKNKDIAQEVINQFPVYDAPGKYISFKRWDQLSEEDNPEVVIFFAKPDVLSGLFTLANFDQTDVQTAIAPFSSGCGSIITFPYQEIDKENPKAILGMFDPSARPFVTENILSLAIPMKKMEVMLANMDESFLATDQWQKVRKRIIR
ncbi:MAG: DUF169 domain-containing protein [Marinifilum sp.]|jgi:uncharacterized protein (DUF169 family)|nr:DUF169 domain-containing protein [Marinifilum sp.]